jgi:hypothetical protein
MSCCSCLPYTATTELALDQSLIVPTALSTNGQSDLKQ